METNNSTSLAGRMVRYAQPEEGEETFLFLVIEDNGDRVHMEHRNDNGSEITSGIVPVETVAREDVVAA